MIDDVNLLNVPEVGNLLNVPKVGNLLNLPKVGNLLNVLCQKSIIGFGGSTFTCQNFLKIVMHILFVVKVVFPNDLETIL